MNGDELTVADYGPIPVADYAFVLRMDDRPGAVELVAATFSRRGTPLTATPGNSGILEPDGSAVVLVRVRATSARKEGLKKTLARLSRVRSPVEHAQDSTDMRRCALVRCRSGRNRRPLRRT